MSPEQRGGHQLAAWPSHQNLLNSADRSYGNLLQGTAARPHSSAFCPGLNLADKLARRAVEFLTQPETALNMNDSAPVSISVQALDLKDEGSINFMLGQTANLGPDTEAQLYWVHETAPKNALMYYHHQGVQYVKPLAENYHHPISTE